MKSEQLNELAAALSKAQGEMRLAELDKENPFFHSWYSTLAAVWTACREPLAKNNLSVVQGIERDEKGTWVRTILMHSSGQFIESLCPVLTSKLDMQSLGSSLSYARRYALAGIVGVASAEDKERNTEDDDGNQADGKQPESNPPPRHLENPPTDASFITEPQRKRLRAIQGKVKMPDADLKNIALKHGIHSSKEIPKGKVYDAICNEVEGWKP